MKILVLHVKTRKLLKIALLSNVILLKSKGSQPAIFKINMVHRSLVHKERDARKETQTLKIDLPVN